MYERSYYGIELITIVPNTLWKTTPFSKKVPKTEKKDKRYGTSQNLWIKKQSYKNTK
jgi:hypothetical protein